MSAIQKLIDLAKDLSISGMAYGQDLDERANAAAEELAQMRASDELRRVATRGALDERDAAQKTVEAYATAARAIALWTDKYCNKDLPYDEMIAQAVRDMVKDLEAKDEALRLAQKDPERKFGAGRAG